MELTLLLKASACFIWSTIACDKQIHKHRANEVGNQDDAYLPHSNGKQFSCVEKKHSTQYVHWYSKASIWANEHLRRLAFVISQWILQMRHCLAHFCVVHVFIRGEKGCHTWTHQHIQCLHWVTNKRIQLSTANPSQEIEFWHALWIRCTRRLQTKAFRDPVQNENWPFFQACFPTLQAIPGIPKVTREANFPNKAIAPLLPEDNVAWYQAK